MLDWIKKYGKVILGGIETAIDITADFVPGGGIVKKGKKFLKKSAGLQNLAKLGKAGAKLGLGTWKDFLDSGVPEFDWSTDIGDLKDGLAGAKAEIESQGQALRGEMQGIKSELQNELQQQGAKFEQEIKNLDAKIANATGEIKIQLEQEKKERERQIQQLQVAINQVSDELNRVENKLTEAINDLREEVNERFTQHEQKILDNKRKIQEEKLAREEEIREVNSNIKLTNTNLENLRQEKSQLEDEFLNYKSTIDRKTAETDQLLEDTQVEHERRTRIIETKMSDQENLLQDFQDNLLNVQNEQAQAKLEREEILEELAEQSDLLHFQKHQLNLVAQQMEDISEEINERMSKVEKDHNSLLNLATETNQKLGNLTDEVKNISQKTAELETQIQENKQNLEAVKKEAQLANERLDNYLKSQSLLNFDQEEQNLARIQKSLQLKAEETKLLATLKLLEETKKLISPQPVEKNSEREWKVGVKEGTEQELPRMEGMPLDPNCRWAKEYSAEQLAEWGWDVRIHNENNESAPLTTPDRRIEEQINNEEEKSLEEENNEQNELLFEQLEDAKSELLARLQEIQSEVNKNLNSAEKQKQKQTNQPNPQQTNSAPANLAEELEQAIQKSQAKANQEQQETLTAEWETIQQISEQVLAETPPEITPELDLQQKLAELAQQINEMEASQVANQKQMTKWMLFLIIFLLEYVVYKKNGILGLVLLNVVLAILYYKKDAILQHRHLWEKYFLIIGYIIGNTLAYSAPENPKYKWPSVIAFNLIILGIYGYTLYQNKLEESQLEQIFTQKTAQIAQEHNIISEEWKTANNSNFVANKQEQLTNLQTLIQDQQILEQKALELQAQTELCQRSAEIESNLKEIHNNLGERKISWTKIKETYPEFAERSTLLKEISLADKFLYKQESKELNNSFLTKLQRISELSSEESALLSKLLLTREQFLAISQQAVHFSKADREYLSDNYSSLDNQQKLSLLNAGLNNLGIDNLDKKRAFVQLNNQISKEKNNFGLTISEKENILRLLINTLSLSKDQQEYLEKMGISFFNASEWTVNQAQKNQLLSFGLQRINLNQKQKGNLVNLANNQFRNFSLSEEQKTILQSLAPLTKEEKYSESSLELLKSLQLKTTSLIFLISEQITPDPNTDFGKITNPYLPLKTKFLLGEQRILQLAEKEKTKQQKAEEINNQKLSIIASLLDFINNWKENPKKNKFDLRTSEYILEKWVEMEALNSWQHDILLTLGLKSIPKYHFFELLKFAVEKVNNQSWNDFLQANHSKKEYKRYLEYRKNKPITINKIIWEKFISANSLQEKNIFKDISLEQLINKQIQQALSNYALKENNSNFEEIPEENPEEIAQSTTASRYDQLLDNLNAEDQIRNQKKQEREAAKKKLEQAETDRRQAKLVEKDKKMKEDEERRNQELLLQEKEEQKRREAEEARSKALQEEQARIFQQKLKNIDEAKKRAESNLANQQKANELAEQKKRDEIAKLERENQQEQERLANQAKLIEEQKIKQLESIALEDKEQRQLIEKRANEEKARIEAEMNEKKRKNEEELKKQENALLKEKEEKQIEIARLEKEVELQRTLGEETKRLGREQERILREQKGLTNQLSAFRENLWQNVLNYYWVSSETRAGTRNPNLNEGGHLRNWLQTYPNMEFNLNFGDILNEVNWSSYKTAMQAFYRTAGNRFVNQYEFKRLLEQKVKSLDFLN
ncbi:MAG: Major outer membrane lipoprotein Lpp [Mycoplasmataceae bacterium]|nr:MAG: Major outer membrane lipoprotein Lpp [Mycoplasmataceae bacterium]